MIELAIENPNNIKLQVNHVFTNDFYEGAQIAVVEVKEDTILCRVRCLDKEKDNTEKEISNTWVKDTKIWLLLNSMCEDCPTYVTGWEAYEKTFIIVISAQIV